jgi:uncharacterized protein YbaR (Trm112 family)
MALNLECPHCKHDGLENHPHQMTEKFDPDADESLVCISMQHFICGRCKIESPCFVYVRYGDVISHMRSEDGKQWFPDSDEMPFNLNADKIFKSALKVSE